MNVIESAFAVLRKMWFWSPWLRRITLKSFFWSFVLLSKEVTQLDAFGRLYKKRFLQFLF